MGVTSGFFNSLNGDRKYSADQMSALIDVLINDGVFANVGTAFAVSATGGNSLSIGIGRAWFNSTWLFNDTLYPLVANNSEIILNRYDAVVIEINRSEAVRSGRIRMVTGVPAGDAQKPTMTHTDEVNQYPLAYIYRAAGSTEIQQADITNCIGTSECPFITGILETQDIDAMVAQWDSEFSLWFEGIKGQLSGDIAANLALKITELEGKFSTLAKEHAVYEGITDSSGQAITDKNGSQILGRTVFLTPSDMPSGGSGVNIPPSTDPDDTFKVGDIMITARSELDSRWLLCNGEMVPVNKASDLVDNFPEFRKFNFENRTSETLATANSYRAEGIFAYLFGKFIQFWRGDDTNVYVDIYEPDGTMHTESVEYTDTTNFLTAVFSSPRVLTYVDGQYIIPDYSTITGSSTTVTASIYVSDDLLSWAKRTISILPWSSTSSSYSKSMVAIFQPVSGGPLCLVLSESVKNSDDATYVNFAYADTLDDTFAVSNPSSVSDVIIRHGINYNELLSRTYTYIDGKICFLSAGNSDYTYLLVVDPSTKSIANYSIAYGTTFSARLPSKVNIGFDGKFYYCIIDDILRRVSASNFFSSTTWSAGQDFGNATFGRFETIKYFGSDINVLILYNGSTYEFKVYQVDGLSSLTLLGSYKTSRHYTATHVAGSVNKIIASCSALSSNEYFVYKDTFADFDSVELPEISMDKSYAYIKVKEM